MPLNDIVNVQITRQTQTVSEAGFGTLMILGTFKRFNDLIRYYSSMQGVAEDFRPSDSEYVAAQAVFSQPITPQQLAIGRRQADNASIEVITAMPGKNYTTIINGTSFTIGSTNTHQASTITFSADFVASNKIDMDINGDPMTQVTRTTDQATTMGLIVTQLLADFPDVIQSVAILPDGVNPNRVLEITSFPNFSAVATNVLVTLGASQATATVVNTTQSTTVESIANAMVQQINNGQVAVVTQSAALITGNSTVVTLNGTPLSPIVWASSNANTLSLIAAQIAGQANIDSATSNGTNSISVVPENGIALTISLVTTLGASQPTWDTEYANPVSAVDNGDGTFSLEANVAGEPYTLDVSTNIVNANSGRVRVEEANPNTLYEVTINGTLFQYTSPVEVQSNEQVAAGLVALINADPQLTVSASDNLDGTFELISDDIALTFVAQVTPTLMTYLFGMNVLPLVPTGVVTDDLDAIVDVDDNWYALAMIDRTSGTVQLVATWVQARVKIFGTASADPNIIDQAVGADTTSIAALFNNQQLTRTFVLYHQDADSDYPECAWFGNCLPFQPGSETWAFKTLVSIAYSDLSNNQSNHVLTKKANTYEYVGGVGITQNGTVSSGEYIDIIRGVDWLTSTIQSYVYGVLVNSPKVPYTDAGITSIEAQIRRALAQGITNNFISADPEPIVTVPKAANVSSADKAARILRNVTFQATLAGAIQAIRIQGTVTV
jgi:hypothetical protein